VKANLVIASLVACSSNTTPYHATTPPPIANEVTAHPHAGDRRGLHGMVLFGRTHHYLEHIPMFGKPHDQQLIMRVTLRDTRGAVIETAFSDTGYSVKPSEEFSLDDLELRTLTTFKGDVYLGNFERDGTVVLQNVQITVDELLVARDLPGSEPIGRGEQEYFVVGEPDDAYLTNVIRSDRGFQQILTADVRGDVPAIQRVVVKSPKRLGIGSVKTTKRVAVSVATELWCLAAPQFVDPCPPL
jgi:hypothetical protein